MDLLLIAVIVLVIDIIVLRLLYPLWNQQIISIQNQPLKVNYFPGALSYLVIILGIYYFIIKDKKPITDAFLLGWMIYAVYELTNKAIINNWNWKTVLVDGVWGGILFGITTWIFYTIKSKN